MLLVFCTTRVQSESAKMDDREQSTMKIQSHECSSQGETGAPQITVGKGLIRYWMQHSLSLSGFVPSPVPALLTSLKLLNGSPWSKVYCLFRHTKKLRKRQACCIRKNSAVNNRIRYNSNGKSFSSILYLGFFWSNPSDNIISSVNISVCLLKRKALSFS